MRLPYDPLKIKYGSRIFYIDLGAEKEKPIGAEKDGRKIAVEIKSFVGGSQVYDLQQAVGQYVMYRNLLAQTKSKRDIYLAIPDYIYATIFSEPVGQLMLEAENIYIIVYAVEDETIVRWIP